MSDIWYLIGYIHIVGWLMACGQHYENCRITGHARKLGHYIVLVLMWPHFLGMK